MAIGPYVMPLAAPIRQCQVYIMLGCSHTPDEVMDRIIFFGRDGMAVREGCGCQAARIGEIEQCGLATQVSSFGSQDTERLREEHIIASCQANAPRGSIKCRQS